MILRTLIRQTVLLSASHFLVRVMGFFLRIWLSHSLGAQAMGLVELAQSAQMLLISPVVSGVPAAVSRMCAAADAPRSARIMRTGALLVLLFSVPVTALAFLFREAIALWLGDIRTLPALLVYLPCIPVLGLSCVLNGYFYASGRPSAPALSEIIEQLVRLLSCVYLVCVLRTWPLMLRAAIPAAAAFTAETLSLLFMLALAFRALFLSAAQGSRRSIAREMLSLALPLTGMRLVSSLMRTVNTSLIPLRLQSSGLSQAEALAELGMLNGMIMPMLMLPSFITCSLCMVCSPELTRRQAQGKPMRSLIVKVLGAALLVGLAAMAAVFLFAPMIARTLYRQAALLPLLRRCCLLIPVMALVQVTGGLMNGLGLQRRSLRISLASGFLSVLLVHGLAAQPQLRLYGAILAVAAGHLLTLCLNLRALAAASDPSRRQNSKAQTAGIQLP